MAVGKTTAAPSLTIVPSHLARRIRLALDHAHRDAVRNEDGYHRLAQELIECEGYPLEKEPWS